MGVVERDVQRGAKGMSWGRTLSPQIVRLDHVRRVNRNLVRPRHVLDSRMTRKNLVSGTQLLRLRLGIWKRRVEDFRR